MSNWYGLFRAEFFKVKHTLFIPAHIIFPLIGTALLGLYISFHDWSPVVVVQSFTEILSILFPLMGALMVSWNLDYEEKAGNLQQLLLDKHSRAVVFMTKTVFLYCLGVLSCILAFLVFAIIQGNGMDSKVYLRILTVICICQIVEYMIHVFLILKFGTGMNIGFGIFEFLISALMLTGLGDGRWQFFPWSWAARTSHYQLTEQPIKEAGWLYLFTAIIMVCFLLYIRKFEGKKND